MSKQIFCVLSIVFFVCTQIQCQDTAGPRQFIIHFTQSPRDADQHKEWTEIVEDSLELVDERLKKDGYLPQTDQEQKIKAQSVHFIRKDHDFGHFTVRVPQGVPSDVFIRYLNQVFDEKKITFHITPDAPVVLAQHKPTQFGVDSLHKLKTGVTITQEETALQKITDPEEREEQEEKIAFLKKVRSLLYWYQEFPTTGLRFSKDHQVSYPFLPHMFTLWDFAPHKGAGIKIGALDSGIAAFVLKDDAAIRKNQDLYMRGNFAEYNYNVVSDDGLDPLHGIIDLMRRYIARDQFDHKDLERLLPEWIKDFILYKRDNALVDYLRQKGKKGLIDAQGNLTSAGKKAITEITIGQDGIAPQGASPRFTVKNLINPPQQNVIVEFVPFEVQQLGHGSHVASLLTGGLQDGRIDNDTGIVGIAPYAETIMIKIFDEQANAQSSTLLAGMNKAVEYDVDILNLSLGVNAGYSSEEEKLFEAPLCSIPYVVAASGNEGFATQTFPARCGYIPFDIGAFDYQGNIPPFSRYERGRGPRFVAPGVAILGALTSIYQTADSWYGLLEGTSAATPIMAGFLALMLGEFKNEFTRDQLLKVCYVSNIRLKNTKDWQQKTLLGVLDMRTALFTLHVLKNLRPLAQKLVSFEDMFDHLLKAINYLIFAMPQYYANQHLQAIQFKDNFIEYRQAAERNKKEYDQFQRTTFFVPRTAQEAINKVTDALIGIIDEKQKAKAAWLPSTLQDDLKKIIIQPSVDLFPQLTKKQKALLVGKETTGYWREVTDKMRQSAQRVVPA